MELYVDPGFASRYPVRAAVQFLDAPLDLIYLGCGPSGPHPFSLLPNMKTPSFNVIVFAAMVFLVSAVTPAQKISPEEKKIVEYIDQHSEDAIKLIEKTVNIESPSEDPAGVKAVGKIMMDEFASIGMKVRWIDMPTEMNRGGHLWAETAGTKGKRLLMLGHLDTVLRGEKFRPDGNKIYGTGTSDMKAGVVLMYSR